MKESGLSFISEGIRIAGVLRTPDEGNGPFPAVMLIHGSLEQDRDGNLLESRDNAVPRKEFFLNIAGRFARSGIATLSYDRRGYGESGGSPGDYHSQAEDALSAFRALSNTPRIDPRRIFVFGQSAGVYVACLLASTMEITPAGYILSGGLYSDCRTLFEYNYGRMLELARRGPEYLEFVERHDPRGLAIGLHLNDIGDAASSGETYFTLGYKERTWRMGIDPALWSGPLEPCALFKHMKGPALIIHGNADMNVPVADATRIQQELLTSVNDDVDLRIIPGADHSFQISPEDQDERMRQRISLSSFSNPFSEEYFDAMIDFIKGRCEDA